MARPVHFEIHASNPDAVRAFYENVFGWTFQKWGEVDYWVITTGDEAMGINGGLTTRQGPPPTDGSAVNAFVNVIGVDNAQRVFDEALAAGATVALPVEKMPGVGTMGYLKDPDGNLFGIIEPEPGSG